MSSIQGKLSGLVAYNAEEYTEKSTGNYNTYAKTLSQFLEGPERDLTPACPYAVRQVILAQHHKKVLEKGAPDGQSIRMKNFYAGTIGGIFTLVARIIRVVVRTLGMIISVPVAAYQQHCYQPHMNEQDKYNIVVEDLRRIGWEWVDLLQTVRAMGTGLVNTVVPLAISTDGMRDYYLNRIQAAHKRNQTFHAAKKEYQNQQQQIYQKWKNAHAS